MPEKTKARKHKPHFTGLFFHGKISRVMRLRKKWKQITALLLAMVLLSGCGLENKVNNDATENSNPMENVAAGNNAGTNGTSAGVPADGDSSAAAGFSIAYELPDMQPGVLVSRSGYPENGRKTVIFRGKKLPGHYEIIDRTEKTVIFTGDLQDVVYNALTEEYNGYGDFSELTTEGEYEIRCDYIGYSYPFTIEKGGLSGKLAEGINELKGPESLADDEIEEACRTVSMLLLSYELYGSVYTQDADTEEAFFAVLRTYIEWLYGKLDSRSGAVLADSEPEDTRTGTVGQEMGGIDYEKTAYISAVLAKFSYSYQKTDSAYATVCLQAADKAWKAVSSKDDMPPALLFYAAGELYRATGQKKYSKVQEKAAERLPETVDNGAQTFGTFTYASTKRKIDVELCGKLLMVLLNRAEEIAACAKDMPYGIGSSITTGEQMQVWWEGVLIASCNYVITNNEYGTLTENYARYFEGINEEAESLLYRTDEETAAYLLLLSEMAGREL